MSRRRQRRPQPTTDQRPPEQRLESLVRERNIDRAMRSLERVLDDLDADPAPGPWIAAARTLSERLIISENALYCFTDLFTECLLFAAAASDPELVQAHLAMEEIERTHGLRDDEVWEPEDAPDDWKTLNDAWNRRAGTMIAAQLRELGHADLAAVREDDPAEFDRRVDQGRIDLWGEDEHEDHPDRDTHGHKHHYDHG